MFVCNTGCPYECFIYVYGPMFFLMLYLCSIERAARMQNLQAGDTLFFGGTFIKSLKGM